MAMKHKYWHTSFISRILFSQGPRTIHETHDELTIICSEYLTILWLIDWCQTNLHGKSQYNSDDLHIPKIIYTWNFPFELWIACNVIRCVEFNKRKFKWDIQTMNNIMVDWICASFVYDLTVHMMMCLWKSIHERITANKCNKTNKLHAHTFTFNTMTLLCLSIF